MTDIFKLPIHPLADAFPKLAKYELQALADDIAENGQLHPIVVGKIDKELMLIDGRNRLAACQLLKIEPEYRELNGVDAVALIVSENIQRRHLTKSQQAMLEAKAYPSGHPGRQINVASGSTTREGSGISPSQTTLKRARTILRDAPDLADVIIAGSITINESYNKLLDRREHKKEDTTLIDELREDAPDLAEIVDNGGELAVVYKAYRERLRAEKANREANLRQISGAIRWFEYLHTMESRRKYLDTLAYSGEVKSELGFDRHQLVVQMRKGIKALSKFIEEIEND